MELPAKLIDVLENAEGKALATYVPDCLHVVPVSVVKVLPEDKIMLVNYFMTKTADNVQKNPFVSLAFWRGLEGYQIKGEVSYETEGAVFDEAVATAADMYPDRTVKAVLIITPKEVFDVSATIEHPGEKIL